MQRRPRCENYNKLLVWYMYPIALSRLLMGKSVPHLHVQKGLPGPGTTSHGNDVKEPIAPAVMAEALL